MKETLFTRHRNTVEPMMLANNRKATLQAIHSDGMFTILDYSSALEYSIIRRYTHIVYYYITHSILKVHIILY